MSPETGLLPDASGRKASFFPSLFTWLRKRVQPVVIVGIRDANGELQATVDGAGNMTSLTPVDPPVAIIPAATVLTVSGGATPAVVSDAIDMTKYCNLVIELSVSGPTTDIDFTFRESVNNIRAAYARDDNASIVDMWLEAGVNPGAGSYDRLIAFRGIGGASYELIASNQDAANEATINFCVARRFHQVHV